MITWKSIIDKLGFDPREYTPTIQNDFEDDSVSSPFSKLTFEESDWLCQQMFGMDSVMN